MRQHERTKRSYFSDERGRMSREHRFSIGIMSDEEIIAHICPEERGELNVENLDTAREMAQKGYSILDISSCFNASRNAIFQALEIQLPGCLRPVPVVKPISPKYTRFRPTESQKKEIVAAYEHGQSSRDIAFEYGTTRQAIKNMLVRAGAKIRDERHDALPRKPHICLTDEITIGKLFDQGVTDVREIVRQMGGCVSKAQVLRCLKQSNKI